MPAFLTSWSARSVTTRISIPANPTRGRSGSSYLCASDLRPHFGLGGESKIDVEIRWPSGVVDKLSGIPIDRIVSVREGSWKLIHRHGSPMAMSEQEEDASGFRYN